jgi:hypothetical protein
MKGMSDMLLVQKLIRFAQKSPHEKRQALRARWRRNPVVLKIMYHVVVRRKNDRTAYVIGLFGTGRWYITELISQNIGERAKYLRYRLRCHSGPTSMIYSGHATIRHVSRAQCHPDVTDRILKAAEARFADVIFIYRHPLDSLLTNWVYWRSYLCNRIVSGISEVYKTTDDLCADLDRNLPEFLAFARGDPDFFAGASDRQRFLSFPEFVDETLLHIQHATLALKLEDFMRDPVTEFSKIADVMSVDLERSGLCVPPPRSKPYGYLAVQERLPGFKRFINELSAETKRGIERIGYDESV